METLLKMKQRSSGSCSSPNPQRELKASPTGSIMWMIIRMVSSQRKNFAKREKSVCRTSEETLHSSLNKTENPGLKRGKKLFSVVALLYQTFHVFFIGNSENI